jgi:hypothetical protein
MCICWFVIEVQNILKIQFNVKHEDVQPHGTQSLCIHFRVLVDGLLMTHTQGRNQSASN